jgi:hypothetical protein
MARNAAGIRPKSKVFRADGLLFWQNRLWYPRQDSGLDFRAREITGWVPVTLAINQNAQPLFTDVDLGAGEQRNAGDVGSRS